MKLQFPLWRLCASVTCFSIAFGLGYWAFHLPQTSATSAFLSIICAILSVGFFAGAIGVLFRCGVAAALTTVQIICSFIP